MSSLKRINSIYDDFLSKVGYDDMNERYYIDVFDYALFSFDKKNYVEFIDLCKERDIFLEVNPKILGDKESNELFRKLKKLKEELFECDDLLKISNYEKEICKLRIKLFEGYQLMIWRMIIINFPNIKESMYKDDIIQMGYVYLVRAIDNFDVDKAPSFDWYLSSYVLNNVFRDIKYIDKKLVLSKDLVKLRDIRSKMMLNNKLVTLDFLIRETGFSEKRVNELLCLEQLIDVCSLDDIEELLYNKDELEYMDKSFYVDEDNSLEQRISNELFREKIIKLVNTLPNEMQRKVVIRYYGLDGNLPLNIMEMCDIFGITRQAVQQHLSNGLTNLKHPLRLKYLKELVKGYTELEFFNDSLEINNNDIEKYKYEELELFLLKQLPDEELLNLILLLDVKYQRVLLSYFGFINFKLSYYDNLKELGISAYVYLKIRNEGLIRLRRLIKEKYVLAGNNVELEDSMDYLMYRYINGSNKKIRSR